jgi:hypothetical protein
MGGEDVTEAIFLSAGVPDPKRAPAYAETADSVAITAAVTALVYVTLGRRLLIWGGHPAITPMIWAVAESMGVDYGQWVRLYQSNWFEDQFPEDNERFRNVTFTDVVDGDQVKSLRHMRERMFKEQQFEAAVFIGGMAGIVEEFDLFTQLQPKANAVPVVSTGGAVLDLTKRVKSLPDDLRSDFDYISLFHRHLHIAPQEMRYSQPAEQPSKVADRMWTSEDKNGPARG